MKNQGPEAIWPLKRFASGEIVGKKADLLILDDVAPKMDKFAPVCPWHIYRGMANHGYIPKTVLLLAHDVVHYAAQYEKTFSLSPVFADTTIIMDNSLVELKKAVDLGMVMHACQIVGADIAVLPDVMGKGKDTFAETAKAYEEWKWKFGEQDIEVMPLIHGKDIQEWFWCAEAMSKACPTDWVGIPRIAEGIKDPKTGKVYSRGDLINKLDYFYDKLMKVHLFGFSDSPWEDIVAARHPAVQSIDSAVPLRLRPNELLTVDAGPRGDWWETCTFDISMIDSCRKVNELIERA